MIIRIIKTLHISSQEIKDLKADLKQKFNMKVNGKKLSGSCRNCAQIYFPELESSYKNKSMMDKISSYLAEKGYFWGCDTHQNTLLSKDAWHCWNANSVMIARIEGIK